MRTGKGGRPPRSYLVDTHPVIAAEFHPDLNTVDVSTLSTGSSRKVWWFHRAEDGKTHEWPATVAHRTAGRGCGVCAGKRVQPGVNDLASLRPEIAADWHPERNAFTAEEVSPGSDKRVWWRCPAGHDYENTVGKRTISGRGCAVCVGQSVLEGFNDLSSRNPQLAAEWHPDLNAPLTPREVTTGSARVVWWLGTCGHSFQARLDRRGVGDGCPICAGVQVVAGINDLATTHPHIAAEWHPQRNLPRTQFDVTAGSDMKVWWIGGGCKHEFQSMINSRTGGSGCGVCHGTQVVKGVNDLASREPAIADEWHPTRNTQQPSEVNFASTSHMWWRCSSGHEWRSVVRTRTVFPRVGCPKCSSSAPEKALFAAVFKIFADVEHDARLPVRWGKRKTSRIDILVRLQFADIVVEYDGQFWHGTKFDKDTAKTLALLDAGFWVVRVREGNLPNLAVSHANLLQVRRLMRSPVESTLPEIVDWVEQKSGQIEQKSGQLRLW